MSESSLYRKYRPQEFKTVRGQDHITSVLEAAIKKEKLGHAYLFSGGRGTGKTSTARIFAKAIDTDPRDLYELDAASNNGVEDIRQILDGISTHPFGSNYKVYIIDEVHMLSKAAFNAFLKTLEEPPQFVIFVLATTELEKVPETIRSRCQVFEFKKPTHAILKELVVDVAKEEGARIDPAGAELIAMMGDGSYRDTLSILQKVLTLSSDKKLSEEEVAKVVGAPRAASINELLEALAKKDAEAAVALIASCADGGIDAKLLAQLVIAKLRAVLLLRFGGKTMLTKVAEQFGEDDAKFLAGLSGNAGAALNSSVLAEMLGAYAQMNRAPMPALSLELAVYRALGAQ